MKVSAEFSIIDHRHMDTALGLARRGLGLVWPNPAVGCVIVDENNLVVGRGWTQIGGRPHGETMALLQAGEKAMGATAYVTLEPCSHRGETPPCADALIKAGIARVVIATDDPDPRVSGAGIKRLETAGLKVDFGLCQEQAVELNKGFFLKTSSKRPMVTLKTATSLDGYIATSTGESQWITGPDARQYGQFLRANHDAILVGSGTALHDDPMLTCRFAGMKPRPLVRVVLDRALRLSLTSNLVTSACDHPLVIICAIGRDTERQKALEDAGVKVIALKDHSFGLSPMDILNELAHMGITRVLIEGGGQVASSFLKDGLIDDVFWFRAPIIIGGDGRSAIAGFDLQSLGKSPEYRCHGQREIGKDQMTHLVRMK